MASLDFCHTLNKQFGLKDKILQQYMQKEDKIFYSSIAHIKVC